MRSKVALIILNLTDRMLVYVLYGHSFTLFPEFCRPARCHDYKKA